MTLVIFEKEDKPPAQPLYYRHYSTGSVKEESDFCMLHTPFSIRSVLIKFIERWEVPNNTDTIHTSQTSMSIITDHLNQNRKSISNYRKRFLKNELKKERRKKASAASSPIPFWFAFSDPENGGTYEGSYPIPPNRIPGQIGRAHV